ncbi:peptidase [Lysobacter lycopersici]
MRDAAPHGAFGIPAFPEPTVTATPKFAVLALSLAAVLTGCPGKNASAPSADAAKPDATAKPQFTLDESKLAPAISFAMSDLDTSKNACSDFNGYVNGKWEAANPIPGDRSSWGAFDALAERSLSVQHQLAEQAAADKNATGVDKLVGDFWASGMDEAKIEQQGMDPIKPELAEIDALTDTASIASYIRTTASKGQNVLFDFGPEADFKNSSMNIGYATQGGLGLPEKGYYFDKDKADKLAAYQAHIAKVLQLGGATAEDAAKQAKDVIAFETRLAKASLSKEETHDVAVYYNPVSPADADKLTPNFPWTQFFQAQGVETPKMFSFAMPKFHEEVDKMLADTPVDAWKAYFRFHAIDGASPYLSKAFADENYDFYGKTMRGQKEQKARWKRVLGAMNGEIGEAFGQEYVKVAFPADSKAKMETLVQNLRDALKARIEHLDWMSDATKAKAIEKWNSFTPKIGYPDKWRSWDGLQTNRDSYIGNILAADEFNYKWQMGKIGKPVDKTEWGMSPQTVNAYYNPFQNEIVFPAAILQPPFFDPKADDATNYGGIGAVIGHEMTHGYDDQGSRFGPDGNFNNWWTDADAKAFKSRTDRLVKQFDAYEALPGLHVKGYQTLGENIADLGGINVAYDAMQRAQPDSKPTTQVDGLSRDQRFFLGFGTIWRGQMTPDYLKVIVNTNEHAPDQFRAIGAPSNMPAFATAFSCKAGDPMVRSGDKQVVIW